MAFLPAVHSLITLMLWWRNDISVIILVQQLLDMPLVGWEVDYYNYTVSMHYTESKSLLALHLYFQRTEQEGFSHLPCGTWEMSNVIVLVS